MEIRRIDSAGDGAINLLDIIPNAKESQKHIYTFQDFKQWINSVDLNQTVMQPIMMSKIKRPQKNQIQESMFKIRTANQGAPDSASYSGHLLVSGPVLQLGLKKRKQSFQSNKLEFDYEERQNSIRQSSAKSSRSFNGYDQINQYELKEKLGKGAFSEVYEGIDVDSEDKKKYAIKVMESKRLKRLKFRKNSFQLRQTLTGPNSLAVNDFPMQSAFRQDQPETEFVNNQIALLKKIDHLYITKLYQVIMDKEKGKAYLVLEYCDNGFICENKNKATKGGHAYRKLMESQCKRYFKQLVLAINYSNFGVNSVHTVVKIAHRDIKPENILISKNDQVKLSDFGLGTDQLETDQHSGTRLFMPPESSGIEGKKVVKTQAADIWGMGVTLLIMLTGSTPEYKNNVVVDLDKRIEELKDTSADLKDFLRRCFEVNPEKRITSEEMLSHPWIAGDDPFGLLIQRSLIKEFQIAVTKQDEQDAIKNVEIKRPKLPKQVNYVVKANMVKLGI